MPRASEIRVKGRPIDRGRYLDALEAFQDWCESAQLPFMVAMIGAMSLYREQWDASQFDAKEPATHTRGSERDGAAVHEVPRVQAARPVPQAEQPAQRAGQVELVQTVREPAAGGAETSRRGRKPRKISAEQAARDHRVMELREQGLTCAAISERIGVSRQRVFQIVKMMKERQVKP